MNFLVVGLGAIGTVFSTFLKDAGHKVYAFVKPYQYELLKNKPLKVSGIFGEKTALPDQLIYEASMLSSYQIDYVLITVKSFDTERVIKDIHSFIWPDALFISAQNGYGNFETIAKHVSESRSLLARIIFGSRLINLGEAEVTVIADDVRIGSPNNVIPKENIVKVINIINSSGIPTSYADHIEAVLWDKILYNCALNPLGAVLECNYGTLASNDYTKNIMNQVIDEIFATAKENNITLNWKNADEYKAHFYSKLVPPTRDHFPSMYYDIKAGKKTEIMALNGAIVSLAKQREISAPVNETITNLILAKENIKDR